MKLKDTNIGDVLFVNDNGWWWLVLLIEKTASSKHKMYYLDCSRKWLVGCMYWWTEEFPKVPGRNIVKIQ